MMLDIVGSVFVSLYVGSILMVVVRRAREVRALKPVLAAIAFWLAAQVALALGSERLGIALQPNLLMFSLTIALLTGAWVFMPAVPRAAAATSLDSLVGLHAWRLGGFLFLLLHAAHRLPAPFAPVAAIGDIITGAAAAVLAIGLNRRNPPGLHAIGAWNAFGLLDLIVAVGLALLATPGAPFQLFFDVPARSAFTQLPWLLVPAAIVPALFFVHLAIFAKLRGELSRGKDWRPAGARR